MNYRHAYHAGNFADVLKHLILTLVIEHLKQKPAPFRVIDTHAGLGRYDLASVEAGKTGEWVDGIGRILSADLSPAVAAILAPYLNEVRAHNSNGALSQYPGSPVLARRLLRRDDRIIVNELHPEDHAVLKAMFDCDPQTKVMQIDGWNAVKALLPPKERRGVILIDPPFEVAGEFDRMKAAIEDGAARFATGTMLLWYPVKNERDIQSFHRDLQRLNIPKILAVTLMVRAPDDGPGLPGNGLVVLNPPFTLPDALAAVLPELVKVLRQGGGASHRIEWLTGEKTT
jgi:23S rRNA (adenine2030-N6)-methyltransferase